MLGFEQMGLQVLVHHQIPVQKLHHQRSQVHYHSGWKLVWSGKEVQIINNIKKQIAVIYPRMEYAALAWSIDIRNMKKSDKGNDRARQN